MCHGTECASVVFSEQLALCQRLQYSDLGHRLKGRTLSQRDIDDLSRPRVALLVRKNHRLFAEGQCSLRRRLRIGQSTFIIGDRSGVIARGTLRVASLKF